MTSSYPCMNLHTIIQPELYKSSWQYMAEIKRKLLGETCFQRNETLPKYQYIYPILVRKKNISLTRKR